MSIQSRIEEIRAELPEHVTLIAVTKTHPIDKLKEAYDAGCRDFGENKVQEMCAKQPELPDDVRWHMIGHVQRNKVKYMAPFVHLIHGVDSYKLLKEINKRAAQNDRVIDCLLQIHIAEEDTKFGFDASELVGLLTDKELDQLKNVRIRGLMGMATFTEDEAQIRREFKSLKELFERVRDFEHNCLVPEILSMGMSSDYLIAIDEGSTMVRIGSAIFGERNYD